MDVLHYLKAYVALGRKCLEPPALTDKQIGTN